ncbi:M56 family metallopeptidase [Candidatus Latescibacterota bacterium]
MGEYTEILETIIHNLWSVSWQVTILIAVIWLIDRLSFRASSLFKYWLWCIVLVRLCIPVSIELPTGIDTSFTERIEQNAPGLNKLPVLRTLSDDFKPLVLSPSPKGPVIVSETPLRKSLLPSLTAIQLLGIIWIVTVTAIVITLFVHVIVISRRLKHSKPIHNPDLVSLLEKLAGKIGISRPVRLLYLDESIGDVPAVAGFIRPRIFLPPRLADNWPADDLEPILLHEVAHIKRNDLLVNWLQIAVQTVYFFHPLVWFANRRIRLLREEVCDDIAVHVIGDRRKRYTKSMLDVVKSADREPSLGFVGIGFTERMSTMGARIRRILSDSYRIVTNLSVLSIALLLLIGFVGISVSCKRSNKGFKVKPPTMELVVRKPDGSDNSTSHNNDYFEIEINELRDIIIDGMIIPPDSVEVTIVKAQRGNGYKQVFLSVDKNVPYGDIVELMKTIKNVQDSIKIEMYIEHTETSEIVLAEVSLAESSGFVDGLLVSSEQDEPSSSRKSAIMLESKVKPNSLQVVLNGDTLNLGKDYSYNPAVNQITISNEQALRPDADLVIKYEEESDSFTISLFLALGNQLRTFLNPKHSIINLAEEVNSSTNIVAKVDTHFNLDSQKIFETPVVFIIANNMTDNAFKLSESERKNLEKYLRNGGFAFIENEVPIYESRIPNVARQMLNDTLGDDAKFLPISENHPLYHCLFDVDDGAPQGGSFAIGDGSIQKLSKGVGDLEGIWLDNRLVVIYSDKGYFYQWNKPESSEPQMKLGVNIIVYALTQEGGIINLNPDQLKKTTPDQ